jgi:ABC-type spermidine/putrescine transport system permease subunit II
MEVIFEVLDRNILSGSLSTAVLSFSLSVDAQIAASFLSQM